MLICFNLKVIALNSKHELCRIYQHKLHAWFPHVRFHVVNCNASLLCKQINMIRYEIFRVALTLPCKYSVSDICYL